MRQWSVAQAKPARRPTPTSSPHPDDQRRTGATGRDGAHGGDSYACTTPSQANQTWNDVDTKLADTMSSYWVNVITKGDPTERPAALSGVQGT